MGVVTAWFLVQWKSRPKASTHLRQAARLPPVKNATFIDYRKRMRRVTLRMTEYVAAQMAGHAHDRLSLAALADVACWSPEHFSRMWMETTGETPLTSVRRSLLELSKDALLLGHSVTSVAERAAYASGQAFAHAFHRQFGRSASGFVHAHNRQDGPSDFRTFAIADPIPLMTAKYFGGYADAGEFSSACMVDLRPVLSRQARGFYFMMDDLPAPDMTPQSRFDYQFGLAKAQRVGLNVRYDESVVKPGQYACFHGIGPWQPGLIDELLREGGWQRRDGQVIERLLTDRALTPEPLRKEYLWVPVAERT
ncbi:MAG: helix-turn-helix domain-containing protein [Rhizobiaceae bacterium]